MNAPFSMNFLNCASGYVKVLLAVRLAWSWARVMSGAFRVKMTNKHGVDTWRMVSVRKYFLLGQLYFLTHPRPLTRKRKRDGTRRAINPPAFTAGMANNPPSFFPTTALVRSFRPDTRSKD
jgi:hypothetical protein